MYKLVLIRHGQSQWNLENRFTGWTDIDLTKIGCEQAKKSGELLKSKGFIFDIAYTSFLKRAIRTLWIILDSMNTMYVPVYKTWRLNERHYGQLQGLNKEDMIKKYGISQVLNWRRSYIVKPEPLDINDKRHPRFDTCYCNLPKNLLPIAESLKDTVDRVVPIWKDSISLAIKSGRRVLISAHGNSLRALIKYLANISDNDIVDLNIPTGQPFVYELNERLFPICWYYI
ncbi:MAG: 2,3-diphosphoglycerate-dependent phosphoglycerate mutase [Bordetella sp.]|nr:MAG: 2,3-diphosphoglycerate-dependent phosphoglycerate mutase [Bordetella sp.]